VSTIGQGPSDMRPLHGRAERRANRAGGKRIIITLAEKSAQIFHGKHESGFD